MDDSLTLLKRTLAVDLSIGMKAQMPPEALIEFLMRVPEFRDMTHLYANRRRPLVLDPSTDDEKREIAEALERVAAWLDDGFHERIVSELREIAGELT